MQFSFAVHDFKDSLKSRSKLKFNRFEHQSIVISTTNDHSCLLSFLADDLFISFSLPAHIIEPGNVSIDFKTFFNLLKNPKSDIGLIQSRDNGSVSVSFDDHSFSVPSSKKFSLPSLPDSPDSSFVISSSLFSYWFPCLLTVIGNPDVKSRDFTNFCNFRCDGNFIFAEATDTFRLIHTKFNNLDHCPNFQFLLHKNALLLLRALASKSGGISFQLFTNFIRISFDNCSILSVRHSFSFPPAHKVIDDHSSSNVRAVLDSQSLILSLDNILPLVDNTYKTVSISFHSDHISLDVFSNDGASIASAPVFGSISGHMNPCKLNALFLRNILKPLASFSELVVLSCSKPNNPVVISLPDNDEFIALISTIK